MNPDYISETDFMSIWGAHVKENGELYMFHEVKGLLLGNIWTVYEDGGIDEDGYSDNNWYAAPGFHPMMALGYLLTEKPWTGDTPHAIWDLDEDEVDREERRQESLEYERRHIDSA